MKPLVAAVFILAAHACEPRSTEEKALIRKGAVSSNDQLAIVETVVRYAVATAHSPCANCGSRDAYCLKVGSGQGVSPHLLRNLSDMQPPILPLAACRTAGFLGELEDANDPIIRVEWLKVISDSAVQARVIAYCGASEPIVQKRGRRWLIEGSGWAESCLLPGDCIHQACATVTFRSRPSQVDSVLGRQVPR